MELKKFELEVECTAFDGSQTFACTATSEKEALEKFESGDCQIIDQNIEVIGLEKKPFSIEESDDISSRLASDRAVLAHTKILSLEAELKRAIDIIEAGDRYGNTDPEYLNSPYCAEVREFLFKHGAISESELPKLKPQTIKSSTK